MSILQTQHCKISASTPVIQLPLCQTRTPHRHPRAVCLLGSSIVPSSKWNMEGTSLSRVTSQLPSLSARFVWHLRPFRHPVLSHPGPELRVTPASERSHHGLIALHKHGYIIIRRQSSTSFFRCINSCGVRCLFFNNRSLDMSWPAMNRSCVDMTVA